MQRYNQGSIWEFIKEVYAYFKKAKKNENQN